MKNLIRLQLYHLNRHRSVLIPVIITFSLIVVTLIMMGKPGLHNQLARIPEFDSSHKNELIQSST